MSSIIKSEEVREKRARIIEQMHALSASAEEAGRDLNDEERTQWDAMDAEQDSLLKRAERLEREHDLARSLENAPRPGHEDADPAKRVMSDDPAERKAQQDRAFTAYLRWGMKGLDEEQRAVMASLRSNVSPEMRAQSIGTDSEGGYLSPEGFQAELEQAMLDYGGMIEACRVIRTATGGVLPWPEVDDTSNKGALLSENTQDSEQDFTFAETQLNAYMYTSKIVRVSLQLMQDSAFDINAFMADALGTRLARIKNQHLTTGTGSSQPNGAVTASTAGKTVASSSAITHDELLDLKHSVDPAYRRSASVRWMFNDATLKALKQLKDGDSRPLWAPGIAVREPDTIDSDRYVVNQDMASMEASAKSVLYGDFSKYICREVLGTQLMRLTERYADYLQVGFLAFLRFDGDLVDAGTNPLKHIIHPSP